MADSSFPYSGIQLIVKDAQKFVSDLGKATKAYDNYAKKLETLQARLSSQRASQERYAKTLRAIVGETGDLKRALQQVIDEFGSVDNAIKDSEKRIESYTETIKNLQELIKQGKKSGTDVSGLEEQLPSFENLLKTEKKRFKALSRDDLSQVQGYFDSITKKIGITEGELSSLEGSFAVKFGGIAKAIGVAGIALAGFVAIVKFAVNDIKRLGSELVQLGSFAFNVVKKGVDAVIGAFQGLAGVAKKLISPFTSFFSRIFEIASGIALYDFVRGLIDDLSRIASEAFDAIAEFQLISVRFQTIVAQDISKQTGKTFADSMDIAIVKSKELLDWVKRLAVQTPFQTVDIANVLALGTAMGMPVEMSQRLTVSIGNMTAALGLSDEVMWRIVYNLGQMIQRGRLTGEEFRDLTRNLFPVYDVLDRIAQQTGQTTEELKALALEGGVPVNQFVEEFIELSEEKFPDAMQKLSGTWKFLTQNIREFFQTFIGMNIFGPMFDKFTQTAGKMFDSFVSSDELIATTQVLGQTLLHAVEFLTPAVDMLVESVKKLFQAFGLIPKVSQPLIQFFDRAKTSFDQLDISIAEAKKDAADGIIGNEPIKQTAYLTDAFEKLIVKILTVVAVIQRFVQAATSAFTGFAQQATGSLDSFGQKMFAFGKNLIAQFAKGMAAGVSLITKVIQFISRLLSSWFKGKSPPKIAADIDKWGANTLTEWLNGFNKGDFSIFNDVADTIESYLRSVAYKVGDKESLFEVITGRVTIAKTIGQVKAGILTVNQAVNKITGSIKYLSNEFRNYIKLVFRAAEAERDMANASNRLKEAQKAIELIQDRINYVQDKYGKILDELQAKLKAVTDEYEDQKRLQKINAALATNLLTADERERLEMEKQSILIKEQIRAKEAERDAIIGGLKYELTLAQQREMQAKMDQEAAQARLDAIQAELEASEALIQAQIKQNSLIEEFLDLLKELKEALSGGGGGGGDEDDNLFNFGGGGLDTGGFDLEEIDFEALWQEAQTAADNLILAWQNAFKPFDEVKDSVTNLKLALSGLKDAFGFFEGSKIQETLKGIADSVKEFFSTNVGRFEDLNYEDVGKAVAPKKQFVPGTFIKEIENFLLLVFSDNGLKAVGEAIKPAVEAVKGLAEALGISGDSISKLGDGQTTFDAFIKALTLFANVIALKLLPTTAKLRAWGLVVSFISEVLKVFNKVADNVRETAVEFGAAIDKMVAAFRDKDIGGMVSGFLEAVWKAIEFVLNTLALAVSGILAVIIGFFGAIIAYVSGWVGTFIDFFVNLYNSLVGNSIIPDMMNDIYDVITGVFESIKTWIGERIEDIKTFFQNLKTDVTTWWKETWEDVKKKAEQLFTGSSGIVEKIKTKVGELKTEIETKVNDIKKNWEEKFKELKDKIVAIFDKNNPDSIVYKILAAFSTLKTEFSNIASSIQTFIETAVDPLTAAWKRVKDGIKAAYDLLLKWLGLSGGGSPEGTGTTYEEHKNMIQTGGSVKANTPYIVGEVRREVFVPGQNGSVIPSIDKFLNVVTQRAIKLGLIQSNYGQQLLTGNIVAAQPVYNVYNIDNSVNVSVDANYKNIQSPSNIRYDISAALATARL